VLRTTPEPPATPSTPPTGRYRRPRDPGLPPTRSALARTLPREGLALLRRQQRRSPHGAIVLSLVTCRAAGRRAGGPPGRSPGGLVR
jgi:hypothetical protein